MRFLTDSAGSVLHIGGATINSPIKPETNSHIPNATLGGIVSGFLSFGFEIAGFLMFVWLIIGALQYMLAEGNKEGLAKARARITWAIIGFLIVIISFALSTYIQNVFKSNFS